MTINLKKVPNRCLFFVIKLELYRHYRHVYKVNNDKLKNTLFLFIYQLFLQL